MKHKLLLFLFVYLAVLAMMAGCSPSKNDLSDLDERELIQRINKLSLSEPDPLISEDVMEACAELSEKAKAFSESDIYDILLDKNVSSIAKVTLIQSSDNINDGKGIMNQEKLEKIISQKSMNEDVRINLIQTLDMSSDGNKSILEAIVKTEDGKIVVRTLLMLMRVDPKKALSISNDVINNPDIYNDDAVQVAAMVKANYYEDMALTDSKKNLSTEKRRLIDLCIKKFEGSSNEVFKDAMIFSLIQMQDFEAVKIVVNHKNIDRILKNNCIQSNYNTLNKVINSSPSKDDVNFIIKCMNMFPLSILEEPIKQKLLTNSEFDSDQVKSVLKVIELRGESIDEKRALKAPETAWLD